MSENPKLYVYVCPHCLRQHEPHVDHNLGLNKTVLCDHGRYGNGNGSDSVQIKRIEVVPAEPIEPQPIRSGGRDTRAAMRMR